MSTLKNKSKSELIEIIESLEMQFQEFKSNEDILLGSEEKFTKTFNSSPSSMIISEIETGNIIDANKSFANMIMYSREELIGKNVLELNLWANPKDREKYIKKMRDDKGVSNLEIELRTKSGDIIATLISGEILTIKDKPYLLTSGTDITERKKTEDALRESENHYRTLVRQTPAVLWTSDQNGQTTFISSNVEKVYGYTPEEIIKSGDRLWFGRIHSEDLASVKAAYAMLMKSGEPYDIEYRIQRQDGDWIWLHDRATCNYEVAGTWRADGVFFDITDRKLAEDALKEQSYLNQQILETTLDGYILGDSDGKIIDVNPAYCDMIGYTWEELLGMNIREVEVKIPREDVDRRTQQMIRRGGDRFETQHKHKDGHILELDTSTSIMYIDEAPLVAAFMRDITKRKKAEDALKTSEDRLRLTTTQVPAVLWTTDTDLRFTSSTGAGLKVLGLKTDQVVGMTMSEYLQTDDPENVVVKAHYQALKGRLATYEFEWEGRVFDSYVKPLQNQEGKTIGIIGFSLDITERKRVGEALKESEEKFRKMFNESPIGIELYKADGMQLTANKASLKMFGIPDESEIYGFNIFDGSSLDVEKKEKLRRGETVEFQSAFDFEKVKELQQYKTDRIGIAYFDYIITPLLDTEKQTTQGYLLQVQDITGRKKVDEALRNSEKKFREMADLSPLIVYEIDINRKLTFFNKRASSVFGFSEHDLMSNFNALDRVIPEDRDRARENMKKIMNGKPVRNTEYTLIKKDGSTFPVLIYSNPVMKDNKPVGLRGIIIDMTERKLAENKIKESQQRLSSHLNNTPLGSIFWDINFKVIEWNSSAEQIFGYSKEEALGKHPYKLIVPKEIRGQIDDIFNHLLTQTGGSRSINENVTKDGKRILCDWYNVAITDLDGKVTGVASLVDDITEQKKTERKLKESRNQLRSLAERLQLIREEERATVAREIHDDLGQTLTALKMDISWMKKNSGMTDEMRASKLDVMLGLTDSTIQTVKRIATELRPGILDDLGLVSAIEWQTKEFQNRSGIKCNFEIFVDEFIVEDDISIAVFRIFQESLTNIARHSQATKVTVTIMREDDFLLVEISDNGVGISEEQISSSKSLGLIGMSERVSVFRGKLTISRAAEGGTAVRVYIPIEKA